MGDKQHLVQSCGTAACKLYTGSAVFLPGGESVLSHCRGSVPGLFLCVGLVNLVSLDQYLGIKTRIIEPCLTACSTWQVLRGLDFTF